jgi:hypothetical protein
MIRENYFFGDFLFPNNRLRKLSQNSMINSAKQQLRQRL